MTNGNNLLKMVCRNNNLRRFFVESREKETLQKSQRINRWCAQKLYYCAGKRHQRSWTVKRGEVYFTDLGENIGSEENKIRPVVILQADAYNFKSPVVICAIVSSSTMTIPDIQIPIKEKYVYVDDNGNEKRLVGSIDLGQIKTIGKERIVGEKICMLKGEIKEVDRKLLNVFGLAAIIKSKENVIKSLQGKIEYIKMQK